MIKFRIAIDGAQSCKCAVEISLFDYCPGRTETATFYGTDNDDYVGSSAISQGITSDPPGLTATTPDADLIYLYGGKDTVEGGGQGYDTIFGGDGNDHFIGVTGYLLGEKGRDTFETSGGSYIDGGPGQDIFWASGG